MIKDPNRPLEVRGPVPSLDSKRFETLPELKLAKLNRPNGRLYPERTTERFV